MDSKRRNNGYRSLTAKEILILQSNGCRSDEWSRVKVVQDFTPQRLTQVEFHGDVRLGSFSGTLEVPNTGRVKAGIHYAILDSVTIGDDVYIYKIGSRISNYRIERGAVVDHVGELITEVGHTFGNGTSVAVINENGGRAVYIYDTMNSHIAYLQAAFRHRPAVVEHLKQAALRRAEEVSLLPGVIGEDAVIRHTKIIRNVTIGPCCRIDGTSALINGTILSSWEMPTRIGINVYAKNFIIQEGSSVSYGSSLENSFIGQTVKIEKQFSAIDSLAFAGSEFGHGEIASVFAGPFSVSHHKGTLLIACSLSFFNSGSGTNQSNHLYKLGPNSQGTLERGCKTASNVYLRWPKRIGAGTVILGEHISPCNLEPFPFSYLIEIGQISVLFPGKNIGTIGIVRDMDKWRKRDARTGPVIRDMLNFTLVNPMTMSSMLRGMELLKGLHDRSEDYPMEGFAVRGTSIEGSQRLYEVMLRSYLGSVITARLMPVFSLEAEPSLQSVLEHLTPRDDAGTGEWTDLGGMIIPRLRIEELCSLIEDGTLRTHEAIEAHLRDSFDRYADDELSWVIAAVERKRHKPLSQFSAGDLLGIVRHWIAAERELFEVRLTDARKEFSVHAKTGYGALSGADVQDEDFLQVNGTLDGNPAVISLKETLEEKERRAQLLIDWFSSIAALPQAT